eukprot:9621115-Heterocapsa_arctica.AAC.1
MSEDLDGAMRFPAHVPCVIFDNLNILYNSESGLFEGMTTEKWAQARAMFVLMDKFRSRCYVCSALASRWGLGSGFDVARARARKFATVMNIPCWSGVSFWDDLEQFTTPWSRVHHGQHKGEDFKGFGDHIALSWHWDRIISAIVSFFNANLYDCQTNIGLKMLM